MTYGNEYLETQVMTATPQQLHLMVINGAIRHATRAEQAIEDGDREVAHLSLNEARRFVGELISGLNSDQSPELVDQLRGMFLFTYRNFVNADLSHDIKLVQDSLQVLRAHRDTWIALTEKLKEQEESENRSAVKPPKLLQNTDDSPHSSYSWTT